MVDKLTAKNAGVDYIHASYGYSAKNINNKNTIHSFNELIKIKIKWERIIINLYFSFALKILTLPIN